MKNQLNFLIIPMDDRPCTYDFPEQLGKIYGANIIMPPKNLLGNLEQVADTEKIKEWFDNNSANLDGIIIASDSLAYGGLIPSRRNYDSFENIIKNISIIKDIKSKNPALPVYVCSTILRISNSNVNQEEKEYWKDYGEILYKYSSLVDKYNLVNLENYNNCISENILISDGTNEEINKIKSKIPDDILNDYIDGRLKNFKVNKLLTNWVIENYIDFLVICADDSGQYGFNVIEKKLLNKKIDDISDKVNIYPGTDEAISALLARMINKINNFTPKFYPVYSVSDQIITMYEGIPIKDTFLSQVKSVGGTISESKKDADITVYLHTATVGQDDQYLNAIYNQPTKKLGEYFIKKDIDKIISEENQNIALIDIAFANGGDNSFMESLAEGYDLTKFISYSAWNTAGNSIGVALAHSSVRHLSKGNADSDKYHYQFLFDRLFDDWLYQGKVRLEFIRENGFPLSPDQLKIMSAQMESTIKHFTEKYLSDKTEFKNIKIQDITYPWKRPFEIDIKTKL